MRKNLKFVALFTAVFMLMAMMAIPASAELSINNASFDSVTAAPRPVDWLPYKSAEEMTLFSSNTYKRGETGYSVEFDTVNCLAAATGTISGTMNGLTEGKLYTVSLYFYVSEAPQSGTGTIKLWSFAENKYDTNGNGVAGNPTVDTLDINNSFADGRWHKLSHTFTVNNISNTSVRIDVLGMGFKIYIDDMGLSEETNALRCNGKPIGQTVTTLDTGFETATAAPRGFTVTVANVSTALSTDCTEGNYALKMTKLAESNNGILRSIGTGVLSPSKQYKLSYKIKRFDPATPVTAAFRLIETANIWHSAVAGPEWEAHEFYFKLTDGFAGTPVLYINLHGFYSSATIGASVLLDDLRIEEVTNVNCFRNSKGFDISSASAGDAIKAHIERVSSTGNPESVLYTVATYKTNSTTGVTTLVNIDYCDIISASGITATPYDVPVTIPASEAGATFSVKGYVWDTLGNIAPLGNAASVVQK